MYKELILRLFDATKNHLSYVYIYKRNKRNIRPSFVKPPLLFSFYNISHVVYLKRADSIRIMQRHQVLFSVGVLSHHYISPLRIEIYSLTTSEVSLGRCCLVIDLQPHATRYLRCYLYNTKILIRHIDNLMHKCK